jgi:hypothetical protein
MISGIHTALSSTFFPPTSTASWEMLKWRHPQADDIADVQYANVQSLSQVRRCSCIFLIRVTAVSYRPRPAACAAPVAFANARASSSVLLNWPSFCSWTTLLAKTSPAVFRVSGACAAAACDVPNPVGNQLAWARHNKMSRYS